MTNSATPRARRALPLLVAAVLAAGAASALRADDCPDAWITSKVKTKMLGNTVTGTFKMNVDTDECVVTLRGCVDTPEQKAEAVKVAESVKGVKEVKNGLSICRKDWIDDDPDAPTKADKAKAKEEKAREKEAKAKEKGASGDQGKVDDCADALITSEVKSMLMATTWIDAYRVNVDTDQCVVTLKGCVKHTEHKAKAEELARKAKGVREVHNEIAACAQ
jgi:osmotically-inducible protein OsmY